MRNHLILLGLVCFITSCQTERAQPWVEKSIVAHGFDSLLGYEVSFEFRGKSYSVLYEENQFTYRRTFSSGEDTVEDVLINSSDFSREVNGAEVTITPLLIEKYSASINSVLYFFILPYPLNDPAATKKLIGYDQIKGETYAMIGVSFTSENGGKDHQDVFLYWINQSSYLIDYLAYSYETEGGGVRFREALRRTEREGMVFQDYMNYQAEIGSELRTLGRKFEDDELKQISLIENTDIKVKSSN